jgi:hypothetical protein
MADTSLVFNILAKDKSSAVFDKIKGSAAVAGVAIGAALAAGVASMLEQSKTQALLEAQLGAGGDFAKDLGEISGALYSRGVAATLEEANAAIKGVWQNGLINEDATNAEIEAVSAKVVNLSTLMGEEADRTSAAVSQMLRTGMAKSSEEAFDILTRGIQQGVNKSDDLLDTFNEYGTQFRKLGLDGPAAMGLLSQAIKAGARDSDTAADALKEFSIKSIDGSKAAANGYKLLGLDAEKMTATMARGGDFANEGLATVLERLRAIKDPVKQNAAAVGLFGTKAEDLGQALYAMDPTTAADGLGKVAGAAQKAGDTLEQSAGAKLDSFKRKAQAALVEKLAEAVPYIEKTFGWLQANSSWVVPLATALGIFAAAIGVIVGAMKLWAIVQTVLNLALWTSPITWIVLGVILLVAAIVLIATKTKWFQNIWNAAWGWIKGAAMAVWNWLKSNWPLLLAIITGPIGLAVRYVVQHWGAIKRAAGAAWDWIKNKVSTFAGWLGGLPARIGGKLSGMWNGLWSGFKSIVNRIIGAWNGLSFGIPSFSFAGMSYGGMSVGTPDIPYLATGGDVRRSGLAVIHKGERVTPAAQVTPLSRTASAGGAGGMRLELAGDREIVALFRRLIRTYNLLGA